jgi:hypothetical protein
MGAGVQDFRNEKIERAGNDDEDMKLHDYFTTAHDWQKTVLTVDSVNFLLHDCSRLSENCLNRRFSQQLFSSHAVELQSVLVTN